MAIVLVCGGRTYAHYATIATVLDSLGPIDLIIHGGAKGADYLAGRYAEVNEINCLRIPAKWHTYDKAAGPIRNREMLDTPSTILRHPIDLVLAFGGSPTTGTGHMVTIARQAGIEVREYDR